MYTGAKRVIRTVYGNSKGFEVKVGMHQGSAFSPLLFMIVMDPYDCHMTTRIGVMSCGTAGPLGSVPRMWNHLQGDQVN